MKRIVLFLCAVLCLSGTGDVFGQESAAPSAKVTKLDQLRSGMRDVLKKHDEIFQCLFNEGGKSSSAAFAKEISEINVSECPRSFQHAWVKYVAAWKVFARDGEPHPDFSKLAELARKNAVGITTGIGKLVGDEAVKNKSDNDFVRAVAEIREVVEKYRIG